jgi:hypothetical protein
MDGGLAQGLSPPSVCVASKVERDGSGAGRPVVMLYLFIDLWHPAVKPQ